MDYTMLMRTTFLYKIILREREVKSKLRYPHNIENCYIIQ